jgi:hypothetical protein
MVALALLALLAVAQLVGLGQDTGETHFDLQADLDGNVGIGAGIASLLGLGRLPLMAWLSVALAAFALVGISVQHLAESLIGHMIPALPASALALLGALPATGLIARPLARIWPQDETTAIDIENLLARRGRIVIGTASRGNPARASVRDQHGQMHNVMVEPHEDGMRFHEGEDVLLVRRHGETFYAVACDPPFLTAGE